MRSTKRNVILNAVGEAVLFVLCSAVRIHAQTSSWVWSESSCRFLLERGTNGPAISATTGYAEIPLSWLASPVVRVATTDGVELSSCMLWASTGELVKVMFDAPKGIYAIHAYMIDAREATTSPAWEPQAGLLLETRERVDGQMEGLQEMRGLWTRAPVVYGISRVQRIYDGVHHHGQSKDFMARYTGWFSVSNAGEYAFATISENASFLLVDAVAVAQWPGWHDVHGGVRGEYSGTIKLAPGRHRIEYFRVQVSLDAVAAVAWRPPGSARFEIMPAEAFVPVQDFRLVRRETPPAAVAPSFMWEMAEHVAVKEGALVTVEFRSPPAVNSGVACRWVFDDGCSAEGSVIRHTFVRPGMHMVKLERGIPGQSIQSLEMPVAVHPRWLQVEEFPQSVFDRQRAELQSRRPDRTRIPDLVALIRFVDTADDKTWLTQLGGQAMSRRREFAAGDADVFYRLAYHYQDPSVRDPDMAALAFRYVLDLQPNDAALVARARLHWGGLLVHAFLKADEAIELLDRVDVALIDGTEKRLLSVYRADALLAQGNARAAQDAYLAIPGTVDPSDVMYSVRRSARLETARSHLGRGEWDGAWKILKEIEWESPLERMGARTGLLMVKLFMARREYAFSLGRCGLLLNAGVTGDDQAEVLFNMTEALSMTGQRDRAEAIRNRLLKDHPNSESAARLKSQGSVPASGKPIRR